MAWCSQPALPRCCCWRVDVTTIRSRSEPRDGGRAVDLVSCLDGQLSRCPIGSRVAFALEGGRDAGFLTAYAQPVRRGERIWYLANESVGAPQGDASVRVVGKAALVGEGQPPGSYRVHAIFTRHPVAREALASPSRTRHWRASRPSCGARDEKGRFRIRAASRSRRCASCDAAEPPQRVFALVIGYNGRPPTATDDSIQPLRYADDDALAFYQLQKEMGAEALLLTAVDAETRRRYPQIAEAVVRRPWTSSSAASPR